MWWTLGAFGNLAMAFAYMGIFWAIFKPLVQTNQLRNRLGVWTAMMFLSCGLLIHIMHFVYFILPTVGIEMEASYSLRDAWMWNFAVADIVVAGIAIYYWTLRAQYGGFLRGAALFDDVRAKQQQALEIQDNIVQGLATAKLALELDQRERSHQALEETLASAKHIITNLIHDLEASGDLRLSRQAASDLGSRARTDGSE